MRSGSVTALTLLAALAIGGGFVALSPEGTVAMQFAAGTIRDCKDFKSQAAAQDFYRQDPADKSLLDEDGNGIACQSYKYAKGTLRDETPKGVVDPPPPFVPTTVSPPVPRPTKRVAVETAVSNTDRPRSDVAK